VQAEGELLQLMQEHLEVQVEEEEAAAQAAQQLEQEMILLHQQL
jgi:hypothetical protein